MKVILHLVSEMGRQRYSESLLQWIWQELQFNCTGLRTTGGQALEVVEPGRLNRGRGPDFLEAVIRIGGLEWHGAVEIHFQEREWFGHGHHKDHAFDGVVLHVVYECNSSRAVRTCGGAIPTLELSQAVGKPLARLLAMNHGSRLPCAGSLNYISREAFEKQVEQAHREYFAFKMDELFRYYDAEAVPSEAWKRMLMHGIFRVLGIPGNQQSMERLAGKLAPLNPEGVSLSEWICRVEQIAFGKDTLHFRWNSSGMRPASRPAVRVVQAAALHYAVCRVGVRGFLHEGIDVWDELVRLAGRENLPGENRREILRGTVFLPAIYILGDLFISDKLKSGSYTAWLRLQAAPPQEVLTPFRQAGFRVTGKANCLGLAHQYKRYCLEKRCHQCKVFKSAINS